MCNVITRRGLEKALNAINAEYIIVARTAVTYESVYCFLSAYEQIRQEHPDATTAADLALRITEEGGREAPLC